MEPILLKKSKRGQTLQDYLQGEPLYFVNVE